MASSKPSATGDKKSKKTSRPSADSSSRSKDKDRKSKDKKSKDKDRKSSKKDKASVPPPPEAVVDTITTPPPIVHDPDAIQLFRRYDRSRSGLLTRLDFLQLFRDYADPASAWGGGVSPARPPLSLTDTRGIPLGYERAEKNSEFEAGQLFERYDKEHTGALTLDSFHVFFADFKPQLRAFIEESNYRALAPSSVSVAPASLHPIQEELAPIIVKFRDAASGGDDEPVSPKVLRTQYRATLWKLRKICKEELFDQRDRIVQRMKGIRDEMASRQRHSQRMGSMRGRRRSKAAAPFFHFDDGLNTDNNGDINADEAMAKRYEEMEDDLDRLDELVRFVQHYLHKGNNVSRREMQKFIDQADNVEDEGLSLAMKDYGETERLAGHENVKESSAPIPPLAPSVPSVPVRPSSTLTDLEGLLRVKDQMIYQLLQERAAMRKERATVETSLKQLSDVSTREMKKWARLTDDMQAEIEQLRLQLRSQTQRNPLTSIQRHSSR